MTDNPSSPRFEQLIIGRPDDGPGSEAKRGTAIPAWLHRSSPSSNGLVIYVPGGIEASPMTGRHDFRPLAAALDKLDYSLLLVQMSPAEPTAYAVFDDCAADIQATVGYANADGFDEIVLLGISMGGPRVAFWNSVYDHE